VLNASDDLKGVLAVELFITRAHICKIIEKGEERRIRFGDGGSVRARR